LPCAIAAAGWASIIKLLENDPDATLLDAWLDFAALKIQAETPEEAISRKANRPTGTLFPNPTPVIWCR
jgi:CRISPR-associated protein Csy2